MLGSFNMNDLNHQYGKQDQQPQQHTEDLLNEFLDSRIYENSNSHENVKDESAPEQGISFNLETNSNTNTTSIDEDQALDYQTNSQNDLIHSLLSQNFLENASNSQDGDYIFKINSSNDSNNSIIPPQTPPNDLVDSSTSFQMLNQKLDDMDVDYGFNDYYEASKLTDIQSEEFQLYEESRRELMKLKFGGPTNSNGTGILSTTVPTQAKSEDMESSSYQIPAEYLDTSNDDNLPYKLKITGLPDHSRVETQIKISLSVSPAPPQFLLQLPSDTISKTKLRLQEEVPESSRKHLLYLDTYVLTSGETLAKKKKTSAINSPLSETGSPSSELVEDIRLNDSMKSCNICSRCVRRELKRASRRKNGTLEDGFNWNLMGPKRAIIFNCKEIISFPPPTVASALTNKTNRDDFEEYLNTEDKKNSQDEEKTIDISSRIICYCRHHSESKGFRLFFVLKNCDGEILGKTFSKPIMIMDRKKSTGSEKINLLNGVKKEHPLSPTSLEESSSEAQTACSDSNRPSKRKRAWSPSAGSASTYYDSVSQQRSISTSVPNNTLAVKRDALSPVDSEHQRSPNILHNTSERSESITSITSNSSSYNTNNNHKNVNNHSTQLQIPSTPLPSSAPNFPSIQRIIPAQGPIRGGVEVTLLGSNFRPGLIVKFGANQALTTHCWSDSTIVTYLPPASVLGQVLVTFENFHSETSPPQQVFTYTDDTDRQLIELALQIVGLKMNGKLEDAKNIAKRIIGNSNDSSNVASPSVTPSSSGKGNQLSTTSIDDDWFFKATETVKKLSQSSSDSEEVLLKFLSLLDLPNAPITTPNWAVCTIEGQTLLHLASIRNYYRLVLYLINKGSRIDYKDVNDFTPLHLAFMNGNREIIEVLRKCGANLNNKIRSSVTLEKISNSNVLDLIPEEYAGSTIDDIKSHSRRSSEDSLSSMFHEFDDSVTYHVSRMVDESFSPFTDLKNEINDNIYNSDNNNVVESDVGDEDADESGLSSSDDESDSDWDRTTIEANNTDQETLPDYDDLYPSSSSLKSLIKSVTGGSKIMESTSTESELEPIDLMTEEDEPADDKVLRFFLNNSARTTPIMRDRMLFFFWLPLLLITVILVLGSNEKLVFEEQFDKFNEFLRMKLLNFMLGRTRVEGMINSVNAAVTAGLNNMTR